MDKRHPIPANFTPRSHVRLSGIVKARGNAEFAPLTRQKVCRVELEVGDLDVNVMACGELADKLACLLSGSLVRITGPLNILRWETGDGTIHERVGISVEELHVEQQT